VDDFARGSAIFLLVLTLLGLLINARPETRVIASAENRAAATYFAIANAGALVLAIMASRDRGRQRTAERFRVAVSVDCEMDDGMRLSARLHDVSPGGASMDWPGERPVPRSVTMHLPEGGTIRADVVRKEDNKLGLRFVPADSRERDATLRWVYSIAAGTLRAPLSMLHLSRRLFSRSVR
jgi:hypothetical protein